MKSLKNSENWSVKARLNDGLRWYQADTIGNSKCILEKRENGNGIPHRFEAFLKFADSLLLYVAVSH